MLDWVGYGFVCAGREERKYGMLFEKVDVLIWFPGWIYAGVMNLVRIMTVSSELPRYSFFFEDNLKACRQDVVLHASQFTFTSKPLDHFLLYTPPFSLSQNHTLFFPFRTTRK